MTLQMARPLPEHLHAVVDMGSNGIRFSISTLQSPTARIMPTLYQHRETISLYDAQYSSTGDRQPIDNATIQAVCSSFRQFQRTCQDFDVPDSNITVLATEATRTAINSREFREAIRQAVGWDVTMLAKEEEGRVGAMGVASSLPEVSGLAMDLGGGSTQLSWLIKTSDEVRMPEQGAVSMPYGAAAMSRRLAEAEKNGSTVQLAEEVKTAVKDAYTSLQVPEELQEVAEQEGGFTLYLSGGGFRGWGYALMSHHAVKPYPIPVINGFSAPRSVFLGTEDVKAAAVAALENSEEEGMFRISDRRASQVPAVAFLINALAEVLPDIKEVRFCQGGVREGYLFSNLSKKVKAQHPLVVATEPFDTVNTSGAITRLLLSALPSSSTNNADDHYTSTFNLSMLEAFANMMYYHSSHSKDLQASSALRSTTSGILAGVHGVLHENRTLLALLLCQRWGADVPPSDMPSKQALEALVASPWTLWWINHLGAVAALIAAVYPAGIREGREGRLAFKCRWEQGKEERTVLVLLLVFGKDVDADSLEKEIKAIEKVGKKKRWIGGRDGVGYKVEILSNSRR